MKNTRLFPFAVLFLSAQAAAEMPLSLEELLTDKGKLPLETSLNYTNTENEQTRLVAPIYIQTGANSYIAIPTSLQRGSRNSDIIVGTAGLRYGITGKTEIYGNASYLWRSDRTFADTAHSSRNKNFSDLSAGISHTFMHDGKNPALIGFAEATLYEKSYGKASSGKSWLLGATTYKAIDPVVLSLTGAVRTNRRKNTDAGSLKTGSYLICSTQALALPPTTASASVAACNGYSAKPTALTAQKYPPATPPPMPLSVLDWASTSRLHSAQTSASMYQGAAARPCGWECSIRFNKNIRQPENNNRYAI